MTVKKTILLVCICFLLTTVALAQQQSAELADGGPRFTPSGGAGDDGGGIPCDCCDDVGGVGAFIKSTPGSVA